MTSNSRPVEFALSRKALFYPSDGIVAVVPVFLGLSAWSTNSAWNVANFSKGTCHRVLLRGRRANGVLIALRCVREDVIWANDARRENMWDLAPQFRVCLDYADLEGATLDGRDFECMGLSNAFLNSATLQAPTYSALIFATLISILRTCGTLIYGAQT